MSSWSSWLNLKKGVGSSAKPLGVPGTTVNTAAKPPAPPTQVDKFEGDGAGLAVGLVASRWPLPIPLTHEARFANAVTMLDTYFDLLDTAAGIGKKDGKIGKKDLEAAAKNMALPQELREACQFLLDNPAAFKQLDVAAGIGKSDGIIGKKDVAAALEKLPQALQVTTPMDSNYQAQWINVLGMLGQDKYFDLLDTAAGIGKKDGKIGKKDLEAAAKNMALPQALRDACQFLLDNPAAFNQLDVAAGIGKCDGIIGKKDIAAAAKTVGEFFINFRAAGTADAEDVKLVKAELAKIPDQYQKLLADKQAELIVVRNNITEHFTDLKGQHPRGWPPGSTWEQVTGVARDKVAVVAVVGHDEAGGPRIGNGGSQSVVLHEMGHVLHNVAGFDQEGFPDAFIAARDADYANLSAYERQEGSAGLQETFAESFARVFGGDPSYAEKCPNLYAYWQSQPTLV